MKKRFVLYGIFFLTAFHLLAQSTTIGGVINMYALGVHKLSSNQIHIDQVSQFNPNDTILIIQMKGAQVNLSNSVDFGTVTNMGNAGNYEFSIINTVDGMNNTITLRCPLTNNYDDSLFQVVKVKSYNNATITSDLTCQPWDGQKGGVLAMFVYGTLTFNANMDVTGKGFRGAVPANANTITVCSAIGNITNYYYTINGWDSSGIKGEGIARLPLFYARGRGKLANGGGGGNSLNSAGGGGSNAGAGGKGGKESGICIPQSDVGGIGGQTLNNVPAKFFMGGGGGCGTFEQNVANATKGGNGGGIVFVLANTIIGNNKQILANGEALTATALDNGSASGGGGGGTIVLNSSQINGQLSLLSKGGNGSSCSSANMQCRGSGGGGGGGWICFSNNINPPSDVSGGASGVAGSLCSSPGYVGATGNTGIILNNFIMPLNCLLDNIISADQTICYGIQPQMLTGTTSAFIVSYQWQYSTDNVNWNNCPATSTQPNYQSGTLYQTTYFRRIANYSNGDITNSNVVTITINPFSINLQPTAIYCYGLCTGTASVIVSPTGSNYSYYWNTGAASSSISELCANNYSVTVTDANGCTKTGSVPVNQPSSALSITLSKTDVTTCFGQSNGSAYASVSGGTSPYTNYHWNTGASTISISGLSAGTYSITVTDSHSCTSVQSTVITQPNQLNLSVHANNVSCYGSNDGSASVLPTGGTPGYTYQWSNSATDSSVINLIAGTYFVTVHDAHSCSVSDTLIINQPLPVTIQLIVQQPTCENTCNGSVTPSAQGGTQPYQYVTNISPSPFTNLCAGLYNMTVTDAHNCAVDTSFTLTPLTVILNNIISGSVAAICQNNTFLLEGSMPTGSSSFSYLWQISYDGSTWNDAPPVNNGVNYLWMVNQSSHFKRIVSGNGCKDTSTVLSIQVDSIINHISILDTVFCSYNVADTINGNAGTGYFYSWQYNSGSGWQPVAGDSADFLPSGINQNTAYRRIVTLNGCHDTSNVIHIYKQNQLITNTILIDADTIYKQFCETAQGTIGGAISGITGAYTVHWQTSIDSVNWNDLDTSTNIIFSLIDDSVRHYFYYRRIIAYSNCFDTSNTVIIDILPPITQNIISSNSGSSPLNICPATNINLGGLTPGGGNGSYTYSWMQSTDYLVWSNAFGGIGYQYPYFNSPLLYDTIYYFRVIKSGVCTDTSNVFAIYVDSLPPNQIACNHTNLCQGTPMDSIYETQPSSIVGLTYQWQWNNNGTWVNITGTNHLYYIPPYTSGPVTYRRVINLHSCSSNSNEITITCYQQPSISYSLVENDSLCLVPNLQVHIQAHLTGTSPWHVSYSINGTNYSFYQMQPDTTYQVPINQSYTLIAINQLTDVSGCTAALNTDTIKIWGFNPVTAQASNRKSCGHSDTLHASPVTVGIGKWILPSGITATNINDPNAQINASSYGSYPLIWEVSNGPCLDTAQISVVFYQQPQQPDAGIDVTLDQISPVLLQATAASVGTGTWSVTQGNAIFTNIHAPNATASTFDEGENVLRWTVVNGVCPALFDDVTITLRTLIVPEGFSPNGDNVNDLFVIKGLDISKEYNLIVFNRWGNIVYEKKPYDNTWDGKDKQQNQLPDDTYFYILKMNDKVYKNGYVVLKR